MKENPDPWQICAGHDVVYILTIGLRFSFGNTNARNFTPKNIESIIRMAYEESHFRRTQLYQSIKNWETSNSPFKVLN